VSQRLELRVSPDVGEDPWLLASALTAHICYRRGTMTARAVRHAHSLTRAGAPARMAWIVLVAIAVLSFVNHAVGSVAIAEKDPEPLMFALFAGLNAYQAVVLLVPYRRLQPWAWWLTWVSVAAFALVFPLTDPELGSFYLGAAVVSALAQAITFRGFRSDRT